MHKTIAVAPGVYALGTDIVNWYLVEDHGRLTAVDAGLPGFAGHLDADLAQLGHRVSDVEAVVLTHSDGDHTGVAPRLRAAGARVLVHAADQATLRRPAAKGGDVLFVGDALITHELVTGGHGAQVMSSYFNVGTAQAMRSLEALESVDAALLLPGHGAPWRDGPAGRRRERPSATRSGSRWSLTPPSTTWTADRLADGHRPDRRRSSWLQITVHTRRAPMMSTTARLWLWANPTPEQLNRRASRCAHRHGTHLNGGDQDEQP